MRQKHLIGGVIAVFVTWNLLTYYTLVSKHGPRVGGEDVDNVLNQLEADVLNQLKDNKALLETLKRMKNETELKYDFEADVKPVDQPKEPLIDPSTVLLPVLVIACDRVTVDRNLDQLLKYRPSAERFPIIVSQDCGDEKTAKVISQYADKVKHIKQPDLSTFTLPWPQRKFQGYYKISRHYKWALNEMFNTFNYSAVIIVEDDLDISPDFFEYFAATYPLLHRDPYLWCVSAWNDNGKGDTVSNDAELLYRTDFFPGLGWMLEKKLWKELEPKWPATFWDDWMRHPEQRKNRQCIRPEICRTSTFGKKGVSKGQFYEKHLKFIRLNTVAVPFTQKDLSYLTKNNYDLQFTKMVYNCPLKDVDDVVTGRLKDLQCIRVEYNTKDELKARAKKLGIMDDVKAGVPRAGYRGVISFMHKSQRVYMAPPPTWNGYDPTWN